MHEPEPITNQPADGGRTESENGPKTQPRVYVASLSDYNEGTLHGAWLDAAVEPDELLEGIQRMLLASPIAGELGVPSEEWAIHDYEGFGSFGLQEYVSAETVTAVALGIAEHGPAFAAWASIAGIDAESLQQFNDAFLGEWDSLHDYASDLLDDLGVERELDKLEAWARVYVTVDAAGFARDLELGGDITAIDTPANTVWLFQSL
jgi:antirestriction protein